jgi:transcriptional regulator NrdR family protein
VRQPRRLLHLDPSASIRFASVDREMETLEALGRAVQGLLDQERVSQQGA